MTTHGYSLPNTRNLQSQPVEYCTLFLRSFILIQKMNIPAIAILLNKQYFFVINYPTIPLINFSTKLTIFPKTRSPVFLRTKTDGFSPFKSSNTSSRKGSLSANR